MRGPLLELLSGNLVIFTVIRRTQKGFASDEI